MAGGQKKKPPYATESELFVRPAYKWLTREEIDRGYHPAKAASIAREREKRVKELNQNNLGNVKKFNDVNARQKTLGNKKQFNDLNARQKTLGNPKGLRDLETKQKTKQSQSSVRNTLEKAFREKKR